MNLSFEVSRPTAHAIRKVSGSYRLKERSVDSIPACSAAAANRTHPSISGSAAGELLLVVATRDVSCAVFMATSPPFGNIQWNLRFIVRFDCVRVIDEARTLTCRPVALQPP